MQYVVYLLYIYIYKIITNSAALSLGWNDAEYSCGYGLKHSVLD